MSIIEESSGSYCSEVSIAPDAIILRKHAYEVRGAVHCEGWDGTIGWLDIKPFFLSLEFDNEELLKQVNDHGFGCESITEADLRIYPIYGDFSSRGPAMDLYITNPAMLAQAKRGI